MIGVKYFEGPPAQRFLEALPSRKFTTRSPESTGFGRSNEDATRVGEPRQARVADFVALAGVAKRRSV